MKVFDVVIGTNKLGVTQSSAVAISSAGAVGSLGYFIDKNTIQMYSDGAIDTDEDGVFNTGFGVPLAFEATTAGILTVAVV